MTTFINATHKLTSPILSFGFLNSFCRWLPKCRVIFDAVSLLIAIPATLIIKLVTGKKTPTFPNVNANIMEHLIAANTDSKDGDIPNRDITPTTSQTMKDVSTLILGCSWGAATLKVTFKNVKLAYKIMTGGVSAGAGSLNPSAVMEVVGIVLDAFSIYKDLVVEPSAADTPGKKLIDITIAVKAYRLPANCLYMVAAELDHAVRRPAFRAHKLLLVLCGVRAATRRDSLGGTRRGTIGDSGSRQLLGSAVSDWVFHCCFPQGEGAACSVGRAGVFSVAAWGTVGTKRAGFKFTYEK